MSLLTKPVLPPVGMPMWLGLQLLGAASVALRPLSHRGLFAIASRVRHFGSADLIVQMHPHVRMYVSPEDAYWLCFVPRSRPYEVEIEALLERFVGFDVQFIDCGANTGYWSIMAARRFGWPVIAVEAAPNTLEKLRRNLDLNECRVTVVKKAISSRDGEIVNFAFDPLWHAGARIVDSSETSIRVPTITIDTALQYVLPRELTILKIDVEGHEQAALDGARKTLNGSCVVIYEEHGSGQCDVTVRLLDEGYSVLFMNRGRFIRIRSGAEARQQLTRPAVGYNFVATRVPWVVERLVA